MKKEQLRSFNILVLIIMLLVIGSIIRNRKTANTKIFDLTKNELNTIATENSKLQIERPKTIKEVIANNLKNENQLKNDAPLPPGANMLTRERIYTQDEINNLTSDGLKDLLIDIERRLPKKSDLKELPPGALHNTPVVVIEAGRNLGVIKEVLKVHENYEPEVIPFYEKCAKNSELPTTVRALCLTNLILIQNKNKQTVDTSAYPKEIVDLTKIVTDK